MLYSNTKVLIIGNGKFEDDQISEIPNISVNNKELVDLFSNDLLFPGIESEKIISLENKKSREITRSLTNFTENASEKDCIVIYLSGHGIVSTVDFKLYFPAKDTGSKFIDDEGISIESLKSRLRSSRATSKILVLDCCFSGRAIDGTMSSDIVSQTITTNVLESVSGTYIMTSACQDRPSLYDPKNKNIPTNFTSKFISSIRDGIDNQKDSLEIGDIFNAIKSLVKTGPTPQASSLNDADKIPLGRNLHDPLRKELIHKIQELESKLEKAHNNASNLSSVKLKKILEENDLLKSQYIKSEKERGKSNSIRVSQQKVIKKLKVKMDNRPDSKKTNSLIKSLLLNFILSFFSFWIYKLLVIDTFHSSWSKWSSKLDTTSSSFILLWFIYFLMLSIVLAYIFKSKK